MKGFSSLRHFERETDNEYQGGHVNFDLKMTDHLGLEFGISKREYKFKTNQGQRLSQEAQNPTLAELGVTSTDLGRVYDFGDGLDVPAGSPTAFFAPNIDAFREIIGFDCSCVNEYGDWTLGYLSNPGNQFSVDEYDTSYFVQLNFDFDLFGHRMFGNFGVRDADTRVGRRATRRTSRRRDRGRSRRGIVQRQPAVVERRLSAHRHRWLRAGWSKVMARPQLRIWRRPSPASPRRHRVDDRAIGDARQSGPVAVPREELRPVPRMVLRGRRSACPPRCSRRT